MTPAPHQGGRNFDEMFGGFFQQPDLADTEVIVGEVFETTPGPDLVDANEGLNVLGETPETEDVLEPADPRELFEYKVKTRDFLPGTAEAIVALTDTANRITELQTGQSKLCARIAHAHGNVLELAETYASLARTELQAVLDNIYAQRTYMLEAVTTLDYLEHYQQAMRSEIAKKDTAIAEANERLQVIEQRMNRLYDEMRDLHASITEADTQIVEELVEAEKTGVDPAGRIAELGRQRDEDAGRLGGANAESQALMAEEHAEKQQKMDLERVRNQYFVHDEKLSRIATTVIEYISQVLGDATTPGGNRDELIGGVVEATRERIYIDSTLLKSAESLRDSPDNIRTVYLTMYEKVQRLMQPARRSISLDRFIKPEFKRPSGSDEVLEMFYAPLRERSLKFAEGDATPIDESDRQLSPAVRSGVGFIGQLNLHASLLEKEKKTTIEDSTNVFRESVTARARGLNLGFVADNQLLSGYTEKCIDVATEAYKLEVQVVAALREEVEQKKHHIEDLEAVKARLVQDIDTIIAHRMKPNSQKKARATERIASLRQNIKDTFEANKQSFEEFKNKTFHTAEEIDHLYQLVDIQKTEPDYDVDELIALEQQCIDLDADYREITEAITEKRRNIAAIEAAIEQTSQEIDALSANLGAAVAERDELLESHELKVVAGTIVSKTENLRELEEREAPILIVASQPLNYDAQLGDSSAHEDSGGQRAEEAEDADEPLAPEIVTTPEGNQPAEAVARRGGGFLGKLKIKRQ